MAKLEVKNLNNEKTKDITLNAKAFGVEVNEIVLKKAIDLRLASLRQGTAKTKTVAEVSGGGRKPWRQKGTGRARQGSTRSTQWRGGGIAGGVNPRSYTFKMNKKDRVLAMKSALTDKVNSKSLVVVDSLELENSKTKTLKNVLDTLKLEGKVLFITASECPNLYLASRNLGYTYTVMTDEVNVYDLVNADVVVMEEAAVKKIEEALSL